MRAEVSCTIARRRDASSSVTRRDVAVLRIAAPTPPRAAPHRRDPRPRRRPPRQAPPSPHPPRRPDQVHLQRDVRRSADKPDGTSESHDRLSCGSCDRELSVAGRRLELRGLDRMDQVRQSRWATSRPPRTSGSRRLVERRLRVAPSGSILVTASPGAPASIGKASDGRSRRRAQPTDQRHSPLRQDRQPPFCSRHSEVGAARCVRTKSTARHEADSSTCRRLKAIRDPPSADRPPARVRGTHRLSLRAASASPGRSLTAEDDLFASLQSRAFRGEL